MGGPTADDLAWICSKVTSFTTDFGVETHLLEMPDISAALVAWAGARPLHSVRHVINQDKRQFWKAMRIAGWSHTMGNIMKATAESFPQWPQFLGIMRALCKFFRNRSYRQSIRRRLRRELSQEDYDALAEFTVGFAKWRYEVLRQLKGLRVVCQVHLLAELFAKAQDQEEISAVILSCRDSVFWRWAASCLDKVFSSEEKFRRWGMVCDCPEHVRERLSGKKFIKCPRTHTSLSQSSFKLSSPNILKTF